MLKGDWVKPSQTGLLIWAVLMLMALIAYITHKERQLANNVVLIDDGVVLEFYHNVSVHIAYADIDKVMFYCEGRGTRGCGISIYTKNGKNHKTINHQDAKDARALRQKIAEHIKSN